MRWDWMSKYIKLCNLEIEMIDVGWWYDRMKMTWNYEELEEVDVVLVKVLLTEIKIQVTQGSTIKLN